VWSDGRTEPGVVVEQRDLVERAKRGDHDAFEALAGPQLSRLDAAARLILRDPELAHDAVQDGFIRAWRNLSALRDPDRFDAWLRRLVVNACLDIARRRRRRAFEVDLSPLDAAFHGDIAGGVADRDQLDQALRRLEPEWRAIVVMHYFLGMPLPDVAQTLGIPLGTAKSRLHRALGLMRITLTGEDTRPTGRIPEGRPV
jgi:RNA polymerase sigma-70 factor (ECF subfamily)